MTTDAALMVAARDDAAAFRELYDRYATRVHGYHLRRSRDHDAGLRPDGRDVRPGLAVAGALPRSRRRSAGPWLFGIARHVLLASVRRGALEDGACERLGVLRVARPDAQRPPSREESGSTALDEALAALPPAQARPCACASWTTSATRTWPSRSTISPEAGARARASRGLAALRDRIDSDGGHPMTTLPTRPDRARRRARARRRRPTSPRDRRRRPPRRPPPPARRRAVLLAVALAVILVPGVALAADPLISTRRTSPPACPPARWRWPARTRPARWCGRTSSTTASWRRRRRRRSRT